MVLGKITQTGAADLLLSLDQERHTARQRSMDFAPGPRGPETCYQVAFVVGNAAAVVAAVRLGKLPGRQARTKRR